MMPETRQPLMAMIFAQLYKVAYLAAKDSNLAI